MGCDIHSFAEKRSNGKWEAVEDFHPFDWRSYGLYGFLADVRNYSGVPVLAMPRGMPDDASATVKEECEQWNSDGHTHSWLSVEELLAFNYDAPVEDRRVTVRVSDNHFDGGRTVIPGQGEMTTWREFLGPDFFRDLQRLKDTGTERVVFWFDN